MRQIKTWLGAMAFCFAFAVISGMEFSDAHIMVAQAQQPDTGAVTRGGTISPGGTLEKGGKMDPTGRTQYGTGGTFNPEAAPSYKREPQPLKPTPEPRTMPTMPEMSKMPTLPQ